MKIYDRLFKDRPEVQQEDFVNNIDHYLDDVEINGPIIIRGEEAGKDVVLMSMDDYKLFSREQWLEGLEK